MKKVIFILALVFLQMSCTQETINKSILDVFKSKSGLSYNESLERWNHLKRKEGNSYSYEISYASWTGYSSTTTIEVENGEIISRSFKSSKLSNTIENPDIKEFESYTETKKDLGIHSLGAELKTIDDYYTDCSLKYLTIENDNNENIMLTFTTNNTGMLTSCGTRDNRCIDDCYLGIRISNFKWIKQ